MLYLYALREIPPEVFEAAELDGFSVWQRIIYIALPLLRPRIQIMLVLQIITVAQVFTEPFILTNGGPANSTTSPCVLEKFKIFFPICNHIGYIILNRMRSKIEKFFEW